MDLETSVSPNSEEIHLLQEEHRRYSEKLESLVSKPYLSADEQMEEVRLKKLKLQVKDRIAGNRRPAAGGYQVA